MKTLKAFRLSTEAIAKLDAQPNATKYIEDLILGKNEVIPVTLTQLNSVIDQLKQDLSSQSPPKTELPTMGKALGLGKACCLTKTPCTHWQFNDISSNWVNKLTGETRDE